MLSCWQWGWWKWTDLEGTKTELAGILDVGIEGDRGSQRQVDRECDALNGEHWRGAGFGWKSCLYFIFRFIHFRFIDI